MTILWLCFLAVFLAIGLSYTLVSLCSQILRSSLRSGNQKRRAVVFKTLGVTDGRDKKLLGFFHPYCNAGGGGERVLWTAIAMLQRTEPDIISVVYSGDIDASKEEIISKVQARMNIKLDPSTLHFVFLKSRNLVEDASWPRFTLLGQSLGSMYLAWEAMSQLIPDLYIDTMGYAFTFHVVSLLSGIPVGAYVHYPTISTEMLARVKSRKKWHTNSDSISSSSILSKAKLLYYRIFMYYYSRSLRCASFLMVNSSWTKNHVDAVLAHTDLFLDLLHLWSTLFFGSSSSASGTRIVYPPCSTGDMVSFPLEGRERVILSVAQFRPEKDHPAKLHALHALFGAHPEYRTDKDSRVTLVLVGGARNAEDVARVDALRALAKELGVEGNVVFVVNASYPDMLAWQKRASIGLSTMVDEHFGINIVEFMACGLIPVTHASGGPLNDIVVPFNGELTGYHATTPETFAEAIHTVLTLSPEADLAIRHRARTWAVSRFSDEEFEKGWNASGWKDWLRK